MKNQSIAPVRSALAIALALAFPGGYAFADEVQELTSPNVSEVTLNVRSQDKVNPLYRLYTGPTSPGTTGSVDINLIRRDENGVWAKLQARELSQRNQELGLSYEKQGDWRIGLDYNEITRYAPYTINTKVSGVGTAKLNINPDFRSNLGLGPESSLKLERTGTTLSGSKFISDNYKFNFSLKTEDKKGAIMSGAYGATWNTPVGSPNPTKNYSANFFAPQPENYRHNQFEASLDYFTKKLQLSGGFYLSVFDNANTALNITPGQNSLTNTPGPITSPWISLQPSNQAWQFDVSGAYNFTDKTRLSFKAAHERATQDAPFIPAYGATTGATYNQVDPPGVPYAPGVATTGGLGGLVETSSYFGMLTSKLNKEMDVLASWRYEDRNDKTPQRYYLDGTANPIEYPNGVLNPRESHRINRGKFELGYRLPAGYRLTGGLDYDNKETPEAYRDSVTDVTARVELRKTLGETLNGKVMIAHSERTGGTWHLLEVPTSGARFSTTTGVAAPLQFADRQRDKVKLMADWSPVDPLSLQFFYEYGLDKYPFRPPSGNAQMGMTQGQTDLFGFDAAYKVSDNWKVNGFYTFNQNRTHQNEVYTPRLAADNNCTGTTIATGSCTPWQADLDMTGEVVGVGTQGKLAGWNLNAKYLYTVDRTKYGITFNPAYPNAAGSSVPAGAGVLPDTVYSINRLNLSGAYPVSKATTLRLDYIYDVRTIDDYTWTNWTYTDGTKVNVNPNQTTQVVGVSVIHSF